MKRNKLLSFVIILSFGLIIVSCDDLLEPQPHNYHDRSRIFKDAPFAEGLLLTAYSALPTSYSFDESATDDATSNLTNSDIARMATGEWSSKFNPQSVWNNAYEQLYYLNYFLYVVDDVEWSWEKEERRELFKNRFTGEAKALRAWYNFELLKRHGGLSSDGQALGFVIIKPEYTSGDDLESLLVLPRDSYEDCIQFILKDIEDAISILPEEYKNVANNSEYNLVNGEQNKNRINGKIVKALKARVLLHIASQDFYTASNKWEDAANAAAVLLSQNNGISGLSPTGVKWYNNSADPDIIWRKNFEQSNSWERDNFPPSLFGNGRINPSQNLVDAFPMANGYPITNPQSGYDPNAPYSNRDPRLNSYIIYDGSQIGNRVIHTNVEGGIDGMNNLVNSTRSGYYLKKLLRESVNLDPTINTNAEHFYTYFRYTEMYLNFAEAANEAWGPNSDPKGYGFTAKSVMEALRKRAGIIQPDNYLNSVSSTKDQFRDLIRNERRIELCFEGFRFWDIRRWNQEINSVVKGMLISNNTYTIVDVENRTFSPHMKYGPIPYEEVLKNSNLKQNAGW
jgi:hypothetical protein